MPSIQTAIHKSGRTRRPSFGRKHERERGRTVSFEKVVHILLSVRYANRPASDQTIRRTDDLKIRIPLYCMTARIVTRSCPTLPHSEMISVSFIASAHCRRCLAHLSVSPFPEPRAKPSCPSLSSPAEHTERLRTSVPDHTDHNTVNTLEHDTRERTGGGVKGR
jgi:hypothetical protein